MGKGYDINGECILTSQKVEILCGEFEKKRGTVENILWTNDLGTLLLVFLDEGEFTNQGVAVYDWEVRVLEIVEPNPYKEEILRQRRDEMEDVRRRIREKKG